MVGHSKEWWMDELAKNPEYDAGWVDLASYFLSTYTYLEEDILVRFSAEQLSVIKQGFEMDKDKIHREFSEYLISTTFNATQLQIIITAYNNDVPLEKIKEYIGYERMPYNKMNYISQALVDGLNVFDDVDYNDYDVDQIYELYAAAKSGVVPSDVIAIYKEYKLPAETMGVIRHTYDLNLDVEYSHDEQTHLVVNLPKF